MNPLSGTLVIAEAGVNHNGSLQRALELVDAAAAAGADIVKFQTFRAGRLASRSAPKADYQKRETGMTESQLDMLRALELDEAAHRALISRCAEKGIEFLSTPFDHESLELLVRTFELPRLKLGSGDLTNAPLLLAIARSAKPLILSTGMATLGDIEAALELGHSAICISENQQFPAHPIVGDLAPDERHALCAQLDCSHCFAAARQPLSEQTHRLPMIVVPISSVTCTIMGARILGSTCFKMIFQVGRPIA